MQQKFDFRTKTVIFIENLSENSFIYNNLLHIENSQKKAEQLLPFCPKNL